jgi:hypothetical protein
MIPSVAKISFSNIPAAPHEKADKLKPACRAQCVNVVAHIKPVARYEKHYIKDCHTGK